MKGKSKFLLSKQKCPEQPLRGWLGSRDSHGLTAIQSTQPAAGESFNFTVRVQNSSLFVVKLSVRDELCAVSCFVCCFMKGGV